MAWPLFNAGVPPSLPFLEMSASSDFNPIETPFATVGDEAKRACDADIVGSRSEYCQNAKIFITLTSISYVIRYLKCLACHRRGHQTCSDRSTFKYAFSFCVIEENDAAVFNYLERVNAARIVFPNKSRSWGVLRVSWRSQLGTPSLHG